MKAQFEIGTKFLTNGKNKRECTIVDILTTTNSKGEIVKICYVADHDFCGQIVTDYDVPAATIARGLVK